METGAPPPDQHPRPRLRRGLYAFSAIAAGIVIADTAPGVHAALWLAAACTALMAAVLLPVRWKIARPLLAVAALCLGAGSMAARVLTIPADRLADVPEAAVLIVRGTVQTPPARDAVSEAWEHPPHWSGPPMRFDVALDGVQRGGEWEGASGDVTVFVRAATLQGRVRAGQRVEVTGHYRPIAGPANPGQRDARRWAAQEGRCGSLSVETPEAVTTLDGSPSLFATTRANASAAIVSLHQRAGDALDTALGPATDDAGAQSRALLKAMLIGDEDPSVRPVSDDMSRLGIVHILSISGFHLVLVSMVVVFLIRLTGDRGVWEYALAAAAIGLYLLVVPAQAPVVRSGLMVLVLLLTEAAGRRYDRLNVLAWTACALALWRPLDLFSPGFQLSFGVTAALIWRAGGWMEAALASGWFGMPGVKGRVRTPPPTARQWVLHELLGLSIATAIAWTVSAAVVAWHMGVLSLLGVIAGIALTVPSIAAIGLGFVAMLAALVWPAAGSVLGHAALFFSDLTVRGSHLAARLPGSSMTLPQVPLAWTLAATTVAVIAIAPGGWRRIGVRIASLACILWLGGILLAAAWPVKTPTIDRFALPKSSATLIRAADQAVLIDPGSAAHKSGAFTLRRAVAACGAWRVRTAVITGPQTDRFDHLPELARALGIETVLVPPALPAVAAGTPDGDPARLLRRLEELGVTVRTLEPGQALTIGDVAIEVEGPGAVRVRLGSVEAERLELPAIEAWEHRTLGP